MAKRLAPHADFLTVNVSSPNMPALCDLQKPENLGAILRAVCEAAGQPVLVKLSPELKDEELHRVVDTCANFGAAGFIATNMSAS